MALKRLGILISGTGSNMKALVEASRSGCLQGLAEVKVVGSNNPDAAGLEWAKNQRLDTFSVTEKTRDARDLAMIEKLKPYNLDALLLAGYDRIVGPNLLQAYHGTILNIHPSLLPAYGGKGMVGIQVHQAVLAAGDAESGCTVHLVDDGVDTGRILGQKTVPVLSEDTPETLQARVLEQEYQLYPQTVKEFLSASS